MKIHPETRSAAALALTRRDGQCAQAEGKLSIYHWFEYIPQELAGQVRRRA